MVSVFFAGLLVGTACVGTAGADEVVPERHDNWSDRGVSPQEGRRLLDTVPGDKGELWVSGGLSAAPCLVGPAERQGDRILIPLSGCDEGEVLTGMTRLPARIAWRTTGMSNMTPYPSSVMTGGDSWLTLPVDRAQAASFLHLMMSYE
ncbi:hypothetical protein OJ723_002225 [Salmonella enterica]|nr:hypothetical protein [Salmonella enterica]